MGKTSNEAKRAWNEAHYTQIKVSVDPKIAETFKKTCKTTGISMANVLSEFNFGSSKIEARSALKLLNERSCGLRALPAARETVGVSGGLHPPLTALKAETRRLQRRGTDAVRSNCNGDIFLKERWNESEVNYILDKLKNFGNAFNISINVELISADDVFNLDAFTNMIGRELRNNGNYNYL